MNNGRFLLGLDIGSSSVKAALLDVETGMAVASAQSPDKELPIIAHKPGWAEQHPDTWWEHVKKATALLAQKANLSEVGAIGISYQMHGLVMVDKNQKALAPAIIWCDSRAVEIGNRAFETLGAQRCLDRLLNSPGNFTASKLSWVKEHQPDIFAQIDKVMLPGDYVAMKLTGKAQTTPSGLSEGILWDYQEHGLAQLVLEHYGIPSQVLPSVVPTFSIQGSVTSQAAQELGVREGIPLAYRAGDQPNNALSLNVLNPGEIAATAGTSGVVYGVTDKASYDPQSRVNTFVHVNYHRDNPRYGVLLCVNGTGILNSWARQTCMAGKSDTLEYAEMNALAQHAPVGSDGLVILPYGNGAERTLTNKNIGASIHGLSFTTHTRAHLLRAVQEGIVFALNYGVEIMRTMGIRVEKIRAGNANMFMSPLFGEAFAAVTGATVELYDTDGALGAARGAGIGAGVYSDAAQAFAPLRAINSITPSSQLSPTYLEAYQRWKTTLHNQLTA